MIINDFDIVGIAIRPTKTDTPLAIDSNAVLAFPLPFEQFEPVAGRNLQILEADCRIENPQFRQCRFLDIAWEFAGKLAIPNLFCFAVAKACDHASKNILTRIYSSSEYIAG